MEIVDSLVNRSEEAVFRELENIASDNGMRVFVKPRLSDVIKKDTTYLTNREFEFYTRSHCDFVITDKQTRPIMIVEYDGPLHRSSVVQQDRDEIKNELCRKAGIGLLRINDRYVTKLYRGMSVLRWIVEVCELEKTFYDAQKNGYIPWDEPFDPAFLIDPNGQHPYQFSAPAIQSFHAYFKTLDRDMPKGLNEISGRDQNGAGRRLAFLYFGNRILFSTTGVRKQDLQFPDDDLLGELVTCDLGILLKKYRKGEVAAISPAAFLPIFESFCERYNAIPFHSMGAFPFEYYWNPAGGLKARQA